MKTKLLKSFFVFFLTAVLVLPTFSQRQTGNLEGKVVDSENSPLPGVALTLSSPALLGTRSFVTGGDGSFRFVALLPGIYTVKCVLSGFKTLTREGLIVNVGKTTTVRFAMEPSPIEEEIIVTTSAPVVDVKSSKANITYTKDLFENIPMSRSLFAIIGSMPGAVVDASMPGSIGEWAASHSFHGSPISHNALAVDGLNTTEGTTGRPLFQPDLSIVEEIEMEIGGHPAEVGGITGAYVNIVSKSGGNEFHGEGTVYYFSEGLVDENFSQQQLDTIGLGSPSFNKNELNLSSSLGGPIFKDKLWFFIAGNFQKSAAAVAGFPLDSTTKIMYGMGKLTFQLNKNIKLMGYYNLAKTWVERRGARYNKTPEATHRMTDRIPNVNVQLNWVLSNNSYLDARVLLFDQKNYYLFYPEAVNENYDRGTGMYSGGYQYEQYSWRIRKSALASYTLFADDFIGGDHEIKTGAEVQQNIQHTAFWNPIPLRSYTSNGSPYYYGDNRGQFIAFAMAGTEEDADAARTDQRATSYFFYIQDSWRIKERLTLNLGLRYEYTTASLPAQYVPEVTYWLWLDPVYFSQKDYAEAKNYVTFKGLQPRLGLAYDIFGNGKTIFKAAYSRYIDPLLIRAFKQVNPNGWGRRTYNWTDNNLNGIFDPAPIDSYTLLSTQGRMDPTGFDIYNYVDKNQKTPKWDEYIVGIDHELLSNFRVGVSYIYKSQKDIWDIIEKDNELNWGTQFTVNDPGYDGIFGTSDDQELTLYDRTRPQGVDFLANVPQAYRKYRGVEFVFEKRMSNKWQLLGSIVYSKSWGTMGTTGGASIGSSKTFMTPNDMINRDGRLDMDVPLVISFQGTYQIPYGINLSAYFVHSSGSPYARAVNVYCPGYGGYYTIRAETVGTRRRPSANYLSLRLEKEFAFRNLGRLGFFLDVYNALNNAYIYTSDDDLLIHGYIEKDGSFKEHPNWQRIINVSSPRYIKLGVRFTF